MGFRFRKLKKVGPIRINMSKSGLGWSIGGKGIRYTKRADGKTQKTFSLPGTGLSYVDVEGNNKHINNNENTLDNSNNNLYEGNETIDSNNNGKKPTKWLKILLGIILYLILFAKATKFCAILTLLGCSFATYYLFFKNNKFKATKLPIKIISGAALFIFTFCFGIGGLFTDTNKPTKNEKVVQAEKQTIGSHENTDKEDALKAEEKANEEAKLKADQEAKQKADEEAKLKAEQEAKQKADEEAKLKAEQEAKQKVEQEAKQKTEQSTSVKATPAVATPPATNSNSNNTNNNADSSVKVWLAASGDCYHSINKCGKMNPAKARQVSLSDAKKNYSACSKCNPPR